MYAGLHRMLRYSCLNANIRYSRNETRRYVSRLDQDQRRRIAKARCFYSQFHLVLAIGVLHVHVSNTSLDFDRLLSLGTFELFTLISAEGNIIYSILDIQMYSSYSCNRLDNYFCHR